MNKSLETIDEDEENTTSLFDESDPRSVINMVSPKIKELIQLSVLARPELFDMPEHRLQKELDPDELADKLRLSFWKEYVRAQDLGISMRITNIYNLLVSKEYFYNCFLIKPENVIWMLCRPEDYFLSLETMLNDGKKSLAKILKMDLFLPSGEIDSKAANVFLKAFDMVQNRVKGALVNKVESKNLHHVVDNSSETLKKELEALRLKQGGDPRDVTET